MEKISSQQIQQDFVLPLATMVSDLTQTISKLEADIVAGNNGLRAIPIGTQMARRSLAILEKFARDLENRRKDIVTGAYRFREDELNSLKEKYKAKTKKN